MTEPRGIRNNNPANLMKSEIYWHGEIPGDDTRFEKFDTPFDGLRAAAKTLVNYQLLHGLRTIEGIMNRFAPPKENNTDAYIVHMCDMMRISRSQHLDLRNEATLTDMLNAIIWHENGKNPYPYGLVLDAVMSALGKKTPSTQEV